MAFSLRFSMEGKIQQTLHKGKELEDGVYGVKMINNRQGERERGRERERERGQGLWSLKPKTLGM